MLHTYNMNKILSSKEICRLFGISESSLRDWEKKGHLKSVLINGIKKFSTQEVDVMFKSLNKKGKIDPLPYHDWFYWFFQSELTKVKIDNFNDYLKVFPCMEKVFKEASDHKYSSDRLENYNFEKISRPDSPLAHHKIHFVPKKTHPQLKFCSSIEPICFNVYFDEIELINNDIVMYVEYSRIEPFYIVLCYNPKENI